MKSATLLVTRSFVSNRRRRGIKKYPKGPAELQIARKCAQKEMGMQHPSDTRSAVSESHGLVQRAHGRRT